MPQLDIAAVRALLGRRPARDGGRIACQACPRVYRNGDEDSARVAGWGIWDGRTRGGQPRRLVSCPRCRGTAGRPA